MINVTVKQLTISLHSTIVSCACAKCDNDIIMKAIISRYFTVKKCLLFILPSVSQNLGSIPSFDAYCYNSQIVTQL